MYGMISLMCCYYFDFKLTDQEINELLNEVKGAAKNESMRIGTNNPTFVT